MLKSHLNIEGIPAILWGTPADRLFIAVHGLLGSKADFELLAEEVTAMECQVLSFDLPEHGERKEEQTACTPPNAIKDLTTVMRHAQTLSNRISLYACSLGAYFSLLTYQDVAMEQCLFQSPVVDMQRLIGNMMKAVGVSEERLQQEKVVANPYGPRLEWDYYSYVMAHPVEKWSVPTAILMGSEDEVSEVEVVKAFASQFDAKVTLLLGSKHYLHTEDECQMIRKWIKEKLQI
jgi:uncharacterized protein